MSILQIVCQKWRGQEKKIFFFLDFFFGGGGGERISQINRAKHYIFKFLPLPQKNPPPPLDIIINIFSKKKKKSENFTNGVLGIKIG